MLNGALNVRHLRREPRTPHNSTASLLVDDLSWDVDIANYSRRGICVKEPPVDLTGRKVTVRLHEGARSLDFHVMWCRSGTAGMHVSQGADPVRIDSFFEALTALKRSAGRASRETSCASGSSWAIARPCRASSGESSAP